MSDYERTDWRDNTISTIHREFGHNYMVDVDFLAIEYKWGYQVKALIEYKMEHSPWAPDTIDTAIPAIKNLADMAGVPFFVVRYAKGGEWWEVYPQNERAFSLCKNTKKMTYGKSKFFKFLDRMPALPLPISQTSQNPL